jgi:hypothetical protein
MIGPKDSRTVQVACSYSEETDENRKKITLRHISQTRKISIAIDGYDVHYSVETVDDDGTVQREKRILRKIVPFYDLNEFRY